METNGSKEHIERGPSIKPIIEDYGDGYIAYCPNCETCLGWESSCTNKCETCGAELDLGVDNGTD